MKVSEFQKRYLRGLMRPEYFYLPFPERSGGSVTINIVEKLIAKDEADIVKARSQMSDGIRLMPYGSYNDLMSWNRPKNIKNYAKSFNISCNNTSGLRQLSVDCSWVPARVGSGTSSKKVTFDDVRTVNRDDRDNFRISNYTLLGLSIGNYGITEGQNAPCSIGIDSHRYRTMYNQHDVSFSDYFTPPADIHNIYRDEGEGDAEALMCNKYSANFNVERNTRDYIISVTEVTPVGEEDPSAEGWYEEDTEHAGKYVPTTDTEVVEGKKYYTADLLNIEEDIIALLPNAKLINNKKDRVYPYSGGSYEYYAIANNKSCYLHIWKPSSGFPTEYTLYVIKTMPTVRFEIGYISAEYSPGGTYTYNDLGTLSGLMYHSVPPISEMEYTLVNSNGTTVREYPDGFGNGHVLGAEDVDGIATITTGEKMIGIKVYIDDEYVGYFSAPMRTTTNTGDIVVNPPKADTPLWVYYAGGTLTSVTYDVTYNLDTPNPGSYSWTVTTQIDDTGTPTRTRKSLMATGAAQYRGGKNRTSSLNYSEFTIPVVSDSPSGRISTTTAIYFGIPTSFDWEDLEGLTHYGISSVRFNNRNINGWNAVKFEDEISRHQIILGDGLTAAMLSACIVAPSYTIGFEEEESEE